MKMKALVQGEDGKDKGKGRDERTARARGDRSDFALSKGALFDIVVITIV